MYSAAERSRILEDLRFVSMPEPEGGHLDRMKEATKVSARPLSFIAAYDGSLDWLSCRESNGLMKLQVIKDVMLKAQGHCVVVPGISAAFKAEP